MSISFDQGMSILQMIFLAAGGLWALWTFYKLQQARKAEQDYQKSRLEQEDIRTNQLRQQPQLAIQLQINEIACFTDMCKSFLCITVKLKNEGEQNLQANFSPTALTVGHVVFNPDKKQTIAIQRYGSPFFCEDNDVPDLKSYRILKVGQAREIALAVIPVSEPGAYILQFQTVYHKTPFEGEVPPKEDPELIDAIEQTIYYATGASTSSTINTSSSNSG
jgi:hypothetical protein